jgi:hypothetical protein
MWRVAQSRHSVANRMEQQDAGEAVLLWISQRSCRMIIAKAYSLNSGDITGGCPAVKPRRFNYCSRNRRKKIVRTDDSEIAV